MEQCGEMHHQIWELRDREVEQDSGSGKVGMLGSWVAVLFTFWSMAAPLDRLAPFTPTLSASTEWVIAAPNTKHVEFLHVHTRQKEGLSVVHRLFLGERKREGKMGVYKRRKN